MQSKSLSIRIILLTIFCLGVACVSRAQSDRGTIAGTIEDSSGGVVTGAQISVKGTDTASEYSAVSGPTGGFRIPEVKVGIYTVTVTANGFKTEVKTGVQVQVNTVSTLDFALTIGDVKDTLTVVADAPSIQSESSDIGTVVSGRQIEDLPLALAATGQSHLRSVESFVFLAPGTVGPGTNDSSGIFESKLNGGQAFSTEVLLDGASIVHAELGSTFDENAPSVEALSEFKVTTSTLPSEFGRTSGGVESFTTKSGANTFHGSAVILLHNDKLNANSWTNDFFQAAKPRDHQKDYGGSLGGPVWIPKLYKGTDKSFFFFEWEQYRNNQGLTSTSTIPTPAELTGDFSALLGPATSVLNPCDNNNPVRFGQIFDPSTTRVVGTTTCRSPFPGNKINTPLSTVAQNVLKFFTVQPNVAPTAANLNGLINNFVFNSVIPILDTTMTFRIDQNVGSKNKFFFSYSSRDQEQINGSPALPRPLDPNFFKSRFSHYVRFGWDDAISPSLVNHLNVGLNRLNDPSQGISFTGQDWEQTLGIKGASGVYFPQFSFSGAPVVSGYQNFGSGSADIAIPNSLIVADSISWVRGRHTIKFGFEWRASQFSRFNNANTSPAFSFENFETGWTLGDTQTGDPFASFLLGLPDSENLRVSSQIPRWNQNYYAAFVQDDFKFRKNLTLNLGFRYDVDTPRHEAHGAQSVLDLTAPNSGGTAAGEVPISPAVPGALIYGSNATGAKTYYKDFGPRIGFAYAPERLFGRLANTVIRGGYGIYYQALGYADFGDSLTAGTTSNPTFSSPNKFTPVQSLDVGFPSFTPPSNAKDPALLNGGFNGSPVYVAKEYGRPGMIQNWSLEVQHQLIPDLILSVGYVGTRATRLFSSLAQINSISPQFYSLGKKLNDSVDSTAGQMTLATLGITPPSWFDPLYSASGTNTVGQLLRPFPQYQAISTDCCRENLGQSSYNAMEAKLERRFRNGLNVLASYTYSKLLTDADSTFPFFSAFNTNDFGAQNPNNLKAEKHLSYQDVPHAFVLSYLYELPVGPGKKYLSHGPASKVLGGWQLSGVHRYQAGTPVVISANVNSPSQSNGNFRVSRVAGASLLSPNHSSFQVLNGANSGCTLDAPGTPAGTYTANSTNSFFNCAAFLNPNDDALLTQRGYVFGDMPLSIGSIRNPGYINEDFSIIKRTTITESHTFIIKVDLPNAFNRHSFGRIDGNITSPTFGVPGGGGHSVLNAPRVIQFTLRYQF